MYEGSSQAVIDPEGELEAKDPDVGDALTYELSGPDAGTIGLSNANQLPLRTTEILAYASSKRAYTVTVIVRDSVLGGLSDIITVTIRLVEVTETSDDSDPKFATEDKEFEVTENSEMLLIGQVEAADANDDTLTYTLGGNDEGFFRIVQTTGELYSKEPLDYESKEGPYQVTVNASDGAGTSDSITVNINVINVNEAPMFVDSRRRHLK